MEKGARSSMTEKYRKYIHETVDDICSERHLKQIYTVVHNLFIREEEETGKKDLDTEEKRIRRAIGAILDELNEEKLKEAHIFLYSYFGTGGIR